MQCGGVGNACDVTQRGANHHNMTQCVPALRKHSDGKLHLRKLCLADIRGTSLSIWWSAAEMCRRSWKLAEAAGKVGRLEEAGRHLGGLAWTQFGIGAVRLASNCVLLGMAACAWRPARAMPLPRRSGGRDRRPRLRNSASRNTY